MSTTTEEVNKKEAQDIINALDEYIYYVAANPIKPKAKPSEVLAALVEVLVVQGVINLDSVTKILNVKKENL